jgi:SAM-dependent methyltransferase
VSRPADHFSRDSRSYAEFRPRYPASLFSWVAALPAARRLAWDAATGSGQAATMLVPHFERVVATDLSREQLQARLEAPGAYYAASLAEASGLRGARVDLVTVAQAYHWFDHSRFHREVSRVIVPGGALAVWCYGVMRAPPDLDAAVTRFYYETVGSYWPAERGHVEKGYRHFEIPIAEVESPPLAIEAELTLPQFLGYVRTWSAVGRFMQAMGYDPVQALGRELGAIWMDPASTRRITWPISVRAGRWIG